MRLLQAKRIHKVGTQGEGDGEGGEGGGEGIGEGVGEGVGEGAGEGGEVPFSNWVQLPCSETRSWPNSTPSKP